MRRYDAEMRRHLRVAGLLVTFVVMAGVALTLGCPKPRGVVLGKVTMELDGHEVVVTDCQRVTAPPAAAPKTPGVVRWAPCRDASITIQGTVLEVNGRRYGPLGAGDSVLLHHDQVVIAGQPASPLPSAQ